MEKDLPPELRAAIQRARARAEASGELRPQRSAGGLRPLPAEVAAFVTRILSDGTYAEEIERIGADDPGVASI